MDYNSLFIKRLLVSLNLMAAIIGGFTAGLAHGQALDSVDVERHGNATEINIRFMTYIQYLRHTPVDFGSTLRVYIQFTGGGVQQDDLIPQTKQFRRTGDVPEITVRFPDSDSSLQITFDQPMKFTVRPSPDGRGITVTLPAAAEK